MLLESGGGVITTMPLSRWLCSRTTWSRRWMNFVPSLRSASSIAAAFAFRGPVFSLPSSIGEPLLMPQSAAAVVAVVRTTRSADLPKERLLPCPGVHMNDSSEGPCDEPSEFE